MKNDLSELRIKLIESDNITNDVMNIINESKRVAFKAIDITLLQRNWLIGKRIYDEEMKDIRKENYGKEIINELSKRLTEEFGKGFDRSNLYHYLQFYKLYPDFVDAVRRQSILSWTHYRVLLQVIDKDARLWYENECREQNWSVRTLQRNINTQYYYRLISSQTKEPVIKEMKEKVQDYQLDKY